MRARLALAAAPAMMLLLAASGASAQDRGVVFTGIRVGEETSAFAGVNRALRGSSLGDGWAVRGILGGGEYEYNSGATRIEGEFVSVDLALVYQISGAAGYANFAFGPRYTDTELTPPDPGNARMGEQWDFLASVDGSHDFGFFEATAFASYGFDIEDYYTRLDVTRALGASGVEVGLEVGAQGDNSYDRQMAGVVFGFAPVGGVWEMRLAAGASTEDGDDSGYASLGVNRTF